MGLTDPLANNDSVLVVYHETTYMWIRAEDYLSFFQGSYGTRMLAACYNRVTVHHAAA
jgi:hypothetical protein